MVRGPADGRIRLDHSLEIRKGAVVHDTAQTIRARLRSVDWKQAASEIDLAGHARLPGLLRPAECRSLERLYSRDELFRSTVDMAPRRFGEGQYRYFAYPLPGTVAALRAALYPPLARIANAWQAALGQSTRFPRTLAGFRSDCRAAGQQRATPLLLRYGAGGYNCLHQDLYGEVAFPLQVAILLSRPGEDFTGGEFLLVEQRIRRQSRGVAIPLQRGEGLVFPNSYRVVRGARGMQRATVRHGVSTVHRGQRTTLGIIFHDAK